MENKPDFVVPAQKSTLPKPSKLWQILTVVFVVATLGLGVLSGFLFIQNDQQAQDLAKAKADLETQTDLANRYQDANQDLTMTVNALQGKSDDETTTETETNDQSQQEETDGQ
jgi:uncharacterized protein HemX